MATEQEQTPPLSAPVQNHNPIRIRRTSKKVTDKTPAFLMARFQGDGVRYKAKLIGVDDVPEPQGDKMCLDSMMKLKGREVAARQQGQHKQRIWLKVSTAGVKIMDEKSGQVELEHPMEQISLVKKDEFDPRAFAYIFGHKGIYKLFFIKMANAADPVIEDFKDVRQIVPLTMLNRVNGETTPMQNSSLLLPDEVAKAPKGLEELDLFGLTPSSPPQHHEEKTSSSTDELLAVFPVSPTAQSPDSPPNPCSSVAGTLQQNLWSTPPAGANPFTQLPATTWASPAPPAGANPFTQQPATTWASPAPPAGANPFTQPPATTWASPAPPAGANPFTQPPATTWAGQRPYGAQPPSPPGLWDSSGTWGPQQPVAAWGQAGTSPQGAPWPQQPGPANVSCPFETDPYAALRSLGTGSSTDT
ncbi:disabled homolog 2-like isoform X2 [Lepisosteus oculatus]|uniref:disabled homolog 2-like isoform X2 n=1 Tax=Lepisosteus oculatus TaxID=7918 RepID=UPI003719F086